MILLSSIVEISTARRLSIKCFIPTRRESVNTNEVCTVKFPYRNIAILNIVLLVLQTPWDHRRAELNVIVVIDIGFDW